MRVADCSSLATFHRFPMARAGRAPFAIVVLLHLSIGGAVAGAAPAARVAARHSLSEVAAPVDHGLARRSQPVPAVDVSECSGNLLVTGTVAYAEPGCSTEELSFVKNVSTMCSSSSRLRRSADVAASSIASCEDVPLGRARVELWSGSSFLFATRTDEVGAFSFCLDNGSNNQVDLYVVVLPCPDGTDDGDACGSLPGVPKPYSVVVTDAANGVYLIDGSISQALDVCTGTVHWDIVDRRAQHNGAEAIYDLLANETFDFLDDEVGWVNTFDLAVRFPDGPSRFASDGDVHIASGDEHDPDIVLSNYALFALHQLYGGTLPATDCAGHGWNVESDPACAWLFGWAAFLQGAIQGDAIIEDRAAPSDPPVVSIDMEVPIPAADGKKQDGAVAASLWDVFDANNEGADAVGFGLDPIWGVVSTYRPGDVCDFRKVFRTIHDPGEAASPVYLAHGIDDCAPLRYAALGDSYSSGEGAYNYEAGSNEPGVNVCHRSLHAYYAFLRAPGQAEPIASLRRVDDDFSADLIACSGAVAGDVFVTSPCASCSDQCTLPCSEPPQLSKIRPDNPAVKVVDHDTDLVTITLGGNDVGFAAVLTACVIADDCEVHQPLVSRGDDRTVREILFDAIESAKPRIAAAYARIQAQAGDATVLVSAYPYLAAGWRECAELRAVAEAGPFVIPVPGEVSVSEQRFIREATDKLNGAVAEVARQAGVFFMPNRGYDDPAEFLGLPYLFFPFAGRELCGTEPPFFNGLNVRGAEKAHPNVSGHRAWADTLSEFLQDRVDLGAPVKENGLPENPGGMPRTTAVEPPAVVSTSLGALEMTAASPPPCETGEVYVPGQALRVVGAGFAAGAVVRVELFSPDEALVWLGDLTTDAEGRIDGVVTLPAEVATPQAALLQASGPDVSGGTRLLMERLVLGESFVADFDSDGVPDLCDNCVEDGNEAQVDVDDDGVGDVCDPCVVDAANDVDRDGLCSDVDPCPIDPANDADGDGVCGDADNCPVDANPDQADTDGDGRGDVCAHVPCHAIEVGVFPEGSGGVASTQFNCGSSAFQEGTTLEVTALAGSGFAFIGWTGDVGGVDNPLSIDVNVPLSVTANFGPVCVLDVDDNGTAETSTDVVYLARHLLGLPIVPSSFRELDPSIPTDEFIGSRIDALGSVLDVDANGNVEVPTDVVYVARHGLGLAVVPSTFRVVDPTIPPDDQIAASIDALCPD